MVLWLQPLNETLKLKQTVDERMYKQHEYYYEFLQLILDRWTRETERSIWAGHYESEKDRINQCFDIANCKAREVYEIDNFVEEKIKWVEPTIETTIVDVPKPSVKPTVKPKPVIVQEEPIVETTIKVESTVEPTVEPEPKQKKIVNIKKWMKDNFPDFTDQPLELPFDMRAEEIISKTPIVNLSLSSHIHNKLHTNNIKTLEELLSLSQTQIEKILYFSETNLLELILELNKLNIKHSFVLSKNILAEILPNATIIKQKPNPKPNPKPTPILGSTPEEELEPSVDLISDFDFSYNIHYRFKALGITTLDQLLAKSTEDLLRIKQFGSVSLQTVIEELDDFGIKHRFVMPSAEEIKEIKAKV